MQWFASAVFKHKAALRKQSGAAQAAGKNIIFACLSMLLYHRRASFAMSAARTKPVLYPNDTQIKPNRREYTPKLFRRTFRRSEFGRAFTLCQRRAGIVLMRMRMIFNNSSANLCGQTFDTPFPLPLFLSAERSGRLKIIRKLYRLFFLRSPVYRGIHRKCCRFRFWFSLPLNGIMTAKIFVGF